MKPGDVIAFSKQSPISWLIELITDSEVAHVGVVLPAKLLIDGEPHGERFNLVAEATASGVRISRLCGLQENYNGEIWWLPLGCRYRKKLEPKLDDFCQFLLDGDGAPYDLEGAIIEGLQELTGKKRSFSNFARSLFRDGGARRIVRQLIRYPELKHIKKLKDLRKKTKVRMYLTNWLITHLKLEGEEDVKRYFCSELVTAAFKQNNIINVEDAETVNPIELCRFRIYAKNYVQFRGEKKEIEEFNSISPCRD
jgi:hypothetical protein